MATATAVQAPKQIWHVRGTWSPREDRIPVAVCMGILWVGLIAGFGVDFPRFLREKPPAPRIVQVHAVVFTVWMLIVTAQVLLVLGDRVVWHRKLGWFAAGWACLMAVVGPWAVMSSFAVGLPGSLAATPFLAVNIVDLGGFFVLLLWGMSLRKNPAAHRRMMLLALIAFADPGFSRFSSYYLPEPKTVVPWFFYNFYGNLLLVGVMAAWDWRRGRLMRSFGIGATALITALFIASCLNFSPGWKAITDRWVLAWARL